MTKMKQKNKAAPRRTSLAVKWIIGVVLLFATLLFGATVWLINHGDNARASIRNEATSIKQDRSLSLAAYNLQHMNDKKTVVDTDGGQLSVTKDANLGNSVGGKISDHPFKKHHKKAASGLDQTAPSQPVIDAMPAPDSAAIIPVVVDSGQQSDYNKCLIEMASKAWGAKPRSGADLAAICHPYLGADQ